MSKPNEIELETEPAADPSDPEPARAEASEGSADSEAQDDQPRDLADRLRIAEESAQQHYNEMLRARAEMDNLRKRVQRDVERARKYALERFMNDLLEVRDSLERAQQAGAEETVTLEHLKEGTELTFKLLKQVLVKHGLEEIDPLGERFNPELHEAISVMQSAEHEPDTVVQVVQKGYLLNDRLIRAARVIVAAHPG